MVRTPLSAHHRIFLLSVWHEQADEYDSEKLRFSLEDPRTGERLFFSGLEKLLTELSQISLNTLGDFKT